LNSEQRDDGERYVYTHEYLPYLVVYQESHAGLSLAVGQSIPNTPASQVVIRMLAAISFRFSAFIA
jgi:hypothetical protein